jgi:ABC-type sugar transport system substrate-binding protein
MINPTYQGVPVKRSIGVQCLIAATAVLTLAACGSSGGTKGASTAPKTITIGVSFDLLNATRQAEKSAIQDAASAAGDKVIFDVADSDAQKQASQIQDLIETQKVSAIIAIAQDGQQITASISLAKAKNVPFIAIDRAVADQSDITFQITGDPVADGGLAAAQFTAVGTPLKVLELVGGLTDQNAIGRRDGFNAALKGNANVTIVSQVPTDWDPTKALDGTSNALQKNPGINGIFIPSDFLLPSVQSALTSAGRQAPIGDPKHVVIVTIDGDQNGCAALKGKTIDADIATLVSEFGKQAVDAADNAVAGKAVSPKTAQIKGLPLNQANFATTNSQVWGCAGS